MQDDLNSTHHHKRNGVHGCVKKYVCPYIAMAMIHIGQNEGHCKVGDSGNHRCNGRKGNVSISEKEPGKKECGFGMMEHMVCGIPIDQFFTVSGKQTGNCDGDHVFGIQHINDCLICGLQIRGLKHIGIQQSLLYRIHQHTSQSICQKQNRKIQEHRFE